MEEEKFPQGMGEEKKPEGIEPEGVKPEGIKPPEPVKAEAQTPFQTPLKKKQWLTALILSVLLGGLGVDRFYLGYTTLGILKLLTAGGWGIWWLIDLILIATGKMEDAKGNELERPEAEKEQKEMGIPGEAKVQTPVKKKGQPVELISIISWILVVVFLISTGSLFKSKNRLTKEKDLLQEQFNATILAKEAVQKKLEDAEAVTSELQTEIDVITAQAQALAREVAAEKAAKSSIELELKASVKEIKSLRQNLGAERAEKTALTQSLTEIARTKRDLQEQLDELKTAKESLEKKLKAVLQKSGVSLEKIVIKPEGRETSKEGQILVVNKEFDFVVINLGLDDGLDIGNVLEIFSGDQVLGRVQVEKIYGNMSAATILPESQKNEIKEGHLVRAL